MKSNGTFSRLPLMVGLVLFLPIGSLLSQTPQPAPSPIPDSEDPAISENGTHSSPGEVAEEKAAFIRVWFMVKADRPVVVRFDNSASESGPALLLNEPPAYQLTTGYRDVQPGAGSVSVLEKKPAMPQLASTPVQIRSGHFYTLIIRSSQSGYRFDLVDDTLQPKPEPKDGEPSQKKLPPPIPKILIYHFVEDLPVEIQSKDNRFAVILNYGDTASLMNPVTKNVILQISCRGPDGRPLIATADADLTFSPSVSLVLIRDSYGRFSPRFIVNGMLD